MEIDCGKKTILRDMKVLKEEFHCPLAFDRARNGCYLRHHGWDFIAPALLDENEMLAAVIGARIAEEIFPVPLKNRIRNAVDYLLQNNNPDFLDTADMESLSILSGLHINLESDTSPFRSEWNSFCSRCCVSSRSVWSEPIAGGCTELGKSTPFGKSQNSTLSMSFSNRIS